MMMMMTELGGEGEQRMGRPEKIWFQNIKDDEAQHGGCDPTGQ